jgi:hypothetical protein
MKIHIGLDMAFHCPQPTPMIFMVNVHPSRAADLITPDRLRVTPGCATTSYIDGFGNTCTRLLAPAGELRVATEAIVADSGAPDHVDLTAEEHAIADLPPETLVFLLASRYCETDRLMEKAWELFGKTPRGWRRVQAICDFVHDHMEFGYQHAAAKRGATEALSERRGVCRDFAHLAITLCRCMNIPARYCTGYLGDIGVPPDPDPMDFSAWFEVYLGGRWHTFDARRRSDHHDLRTQHAQAISGAHRRGDRANACALGRRVARRPAAFTTRCGLICRMFGRDDAQASSRVAVKACRLPEARSGTDRALGFRARAHHHRLAISTVGAGHRVVVGRRRAGLERFEDRSRRAGRSA